MEQQGSFFGMMRGRPSAYLPLAMSLASLSMVLVVVGVGIAMHGGIVREKDEGSVAHIFQLLMTLQLPVALFFAVKWVPREPGRALKVVALQAAAWMAACAPVFLLKL